MKKILLACDLDNTLMYSYKHKNDGDVCVEWLDGQEQGFMTRRTCEMLKELGQRADILFVPVTTRSIDQYLRIKWPEGSQPQLAVTTNGAFLLAAGEKDGEWEEESRRTVELYEAEMKRLKSELEVQEKYSKCRIVDGMFLFAPCKDAEEAVEGENEYRGRTPFDVAASGRKLYFFPPEFNKGAAVLELRRRFPAEALICAGDSSIDIPMLEEAGLAIVPEMPMKELLRNPDVSVCPAGMNFAEYILEKALG